MSWRFAQLPRAAVLGIASPAIAADRAQEACEQSKRGGQDWDKQIIGCSALLSRSSLTNGDRAITLANRALGGEASGLEAALLPANKADHTGSPRRVQPEPDDVGLDGAEGGDDTVLVIMTILGVSGDEAVEYFPFDPYSPR